MVHPDKIPLKKLVSALLAIAFGTIIEWVRKHFSTPSTAAPRRRPATLLVPVITTVLLSVLSAGYLHDPNTIITILQYDFTVSSSRLCSPFKRGGSTILINCG